MLSRLDVRADAQRMIVTSGITARISHCGAAQGNCRVRTVSSSGTISTIAGTGNCGYTTIGFTNPCGFITGDGAPATCAELNGPYGVGIDSAGNIYIGDSVSDCGKHAV